jgi:hypothetical protein
MRALLLPVLAGLVLALAGPASATSTRTYVGRFGPDSNPSRFGKPSAYTPRQLHPFSADDGAYFYALHWRDWGHGTATATGKAVANDCTPNCAQGHFRYKGGARASASRLRSGRCYGKPARFYTRVRLRFPSGLGLKPFTVRLTTGCGGS